MSLMYLMICRGPSTAEVEHFGFGSALQESVWLGRVFAFAKKLSVPPEIVIGDDNQGSIKRAKTDSSGKRTKLPTSNIILFAYYYKNKNSR